jgi:hypothetical protein
LRSLQNIPICRTDSLNCSKTTGCCAQAFAPSLQPSIRSLSSFDEVRTTIGIALVRASARMARNTSMPLLWGGFRSSRTNLREWTNGRSLCAPRQTGSPGPRHRPARRESPWRFRCGATRESSTPHPQQNPPATESPPHATCISSSIMEGSGGALGWFSGTPIVRKNVAPDRFLLRLKSASI